MNTKYVAEFRTVEATDEKTEMEQDTSLEETTKKTRKIDAKTVGKYGATMIVVAAVSSQIYAKLQSTKNSITGNTIGQRKLDNSMAYLNEGLQGGGGIAVGLLLGGVKGVVAGALAYATKTAMGAFNTAQENQIKQASWAVESLVNSEKQSRLVKDITGIRI